MIKEIVSRGQTGIDQTEFFIATELELPVGGFHLEAKLKKNRINPKTQAPSDTLIYALYDMDTLPSLSVHWPTSS